MLECQFLRVFERSTLQNFKLYHQTNSSELLFHTTFNMISFYFFEFLYIYLIVDNKKKCILYYYIRAVHNLVSNLDHFHFCSINCNTLFQHWSHLMS